ncbi:MAG TPA: beta-galactosidase, partial [Planctomycetota bacterium]|nr:beta-galactosidase [Planctomycetota bacterium]
MLESTPERSGEMMKRLSPLWIGTQYYRAPTPTPEEWEPDLKAIAAGGLNGVQLRLQWRWIERIRDEFYFDDHDRLVKLCKQNGLTVIIKFICETAPDYVYHELNGTRIDFRGRPILPESNGSMYVGGWLPDFNNPEVMHRAMNFVGRCVSRYRKEDHVVAWHLWNEPRSRPSNDMAGPHGLKLFRAWLQDQYKSIEHFNKITGKAWASFDMVTPADSPSEHLEWFLWRKFCAKRVAENLQKTRQAVHNADNSRPCLCHSGYNSSMQDPLTDITDDLANAKAAERYGTSLVNFEGDCPDFSRLEGEASVSRDETRRSMYITSLQCDWMRA